MITLDMAVFVGSAQKRWFIKCIRQEERELTDEIDYNREKDICNPPCPSDLHHVVVGR